MESTCYLLNNYLLFTGDTLFPTGIGRPDLETDEQQVRLRASALYHSLRKLLALPSETLVLPGHISTPVPFDGEPIVTTLAEINEQVGIIHATHDLFVQMILARLPATPPNYERIVRYNETGILPESDVTELELAHADFSVRVKRDPDAARAAGWPRTTESVLEDEAARLHRVVAPFTGQSRCFLQRLRPQSWSLIIGRFGIGY